MVMNFVKKLCPDFTNEKKCGMVGKCTHQRRHKRNLKKVRKNRNRTDISREQEVWIMLNENFVTLEIGKAKNIALVAHDGKKAELVDWCDANKDVLKSHFLCGTGTTAKLIAERTGLPVKGYCSGPLGGDQQIGAKIVEGKIDFMIFLWDPLEAQPHDPDVKALLRIAVVYDIPIANNLATADFMLHSRFMNEPYSRKIENFNKTIQDRVEKMK